MRVLVTGANGFIGARVVPALLAAGHEPVCMVRATSDTARIDGISVERRVGDVLDPGSLESAMIGCDAVVHLAALASWDLVDKPANRTVILEGTSNVLAAAAATNTRRIVYVSSIVTVAGSLEPETFDETSVPAAPLGKLGYAAAKYEAEQLCRQAATGDLEVVTVNPAEVYGPGDTARITCGNLIDMVAGPAAVIVRGGTGVVHVDDVASGIVAALERGRSGERYLLAGENLTTRQLADECRRAVGLAPRAVTLPRWLALLLSWMGRRLHVPLPVSPWVLPYAVRFWFASSGKAEREIGWSYRPAHSTIRETLEWCSSEGMISRSVVAAEA